MSAAELSLGPWRIGDAGHTVFGPPNGKPVPEIIATNLTRGNARLLHEAGNVAHETGLTPRELADQRTHVTQLMEALRAFMVCGLGGSGNGSHFHEDYDFAYAKAQEVIAKVATTQGFKQVGAPGSSHDAAALIADAFIVAQETGLAPSALAKQRDELFEVVRDMICAADELTDGQLSADCQSERDFIAAHEAARVVMLKMAGHYDALVERTQDAAEGPVRITLMTAEGAAAYEPSSRDLVLEASNEGDPPKPKDRGMSP